jgi:uncharacterized membrane protein
MNRKDLLRSVDMFEGLSEPDLDELAGEVIERRFTKGQVVFSQGDHGTAMYIVAQGGVNIFLPGPHSHRVSLKDLSRGDYFGELALFDDKPRSASALATATEVVLIELTRDVLSHYIEHHPGAAMAILRTMTAHLRATDALLSQRAAKNVDAEFDRNLTWSDILADKVAELNGSWRFILALGVVVALWSLVNSSLFFKSPIDPYPFVFFNLLLGVLVALQGPLIVMSQNRQGLKDRARAETDFKVNLKNELNIERLLKDVLRIRAHLGIAGDEKLDEAVAEPGAKTLADHERG